VAARLMTAGHRGMLSRPAGAGKTPGPMVEDLAAPIARGQDERHLLRVEPPGDG
jgi:hypothetical protein